VLEFKEGKYSGFRSEKSQWEAFATLQTRLAVEDPQFMVKANTVANQLGIDIDMAGGSIGWAIECFENGIIDETDTGGIKLEWGKSEQILELIEQISYRRGFGNILAEGCARASDSFGEESKKYCMHLKNQELYEPLRGAMAWALGTVVSTRGGGHTTGTPQMETIGKLNAEKMSDLYGIDPEDIDPLSYKGKPEIVIFTEALHRAANSLGICQFNTIWVDFDFIDLEDMAELYSSATGIEKNADDLRLMTIRQLNLEKVFNIRHAGFDRTDDLPTHRDLNEPIPTGKLKGWHIDKSKWNKMLDHYYELQGWDTATGFPTKQTLDKLGIGYAFTDIQDK
jgi:aldehyde:ferredoxin oxidoreductase